MNKGNDENSLYGMWEENGLLSVIGNKIRYLGGSQNEGVEKPDRDFL